MKKIYYLSLLFTASLLLPSCDMNKEPVGSLFDEDGIESPADVRSYRNSLYVSMRFLTTGGFINYGELQTDLYHLVSGNNVMGTGFNTGNLLPAMEEFEGIWGNCYSVIGSVNFMLSKTWPLISSGTFTDRQNIEMRRYIGEGLFVRAYCYYYLAEKFCAAYNPQTAGQPASGVPVVTDYDPTDDNSQYPPRNTLQETYARITADLEEALGYLLEYEAAESLDGDLPSVMSPYVTSDVVKAMQARVALTMKNYPVALATAEEVINSRNYAIEPSITLQYFWRNDWGNEAIMIVTMTPQHLGSPTGNYFLANTGNPAFIPTQASLDLFDKDADNRYGVYFKDQTIILSNKTTTVKNFSKYPGNPYLIISTNNFTQMGKPFRISEQYLIAAEAAAELTQDTKANNYLNALKSRRINGWVNEQLSGEYLRSMIREERTRELFGEGFRLGDLKRWGMGFTRSEGQDNSVINTNGNIHRTSYQQDDHRFLWPIPKAELDANPQIKGQQNPGY